MRTLFYTLLLALCMVSCTEPRTFKIKGEVEGGGDFNIYVKYYADDAVQRSIMQVKNGKFEGEFPGKEMSLVELYDNDMQRLGMLCLKAGDELQLSLNPDNQYLNSCVGDSINQQMLDAINANAEILNRGDSQEVNAFIESYVGEHPDRVASTALFVALYDASTDPLRADSILGMLDAEAQVGSLLSAMVMQLSPYARHDAYGPVQPIKYRTRDNDSTNVFDPHDKKASLIVLSTEHSWRSDSVLPHIKRINKAFKGADLQIFDLSLYTDLYSWRGATARDSATWIQAWIPGGVLTPDVKRLAIPSMPYYIVTDSVGTQHYRGTSPTDAEQAIGVVIADSVATPKRRL